MADRDWDKELAKVDKQLASLSDEALLGNATPAPVAKGAREAGRVPARSPAAEPVAAAAPKSTSAFGVYARLALAVTVAGAMMIWPYPAKCGLGLAGYLAAVGVVVAGGLWSSVWTWRHRAARSHTVSLLVLTWGLVLGAIEVLPRIGYAKPDANHPATWVCQ
jgi:hypothetical protein